MRPADCRGLYARLCDPESGLPDDLTAAALRAELDRHRRPPADPAVLSGLVEQAAAWSVEEADRFLAAAAGVDPVVPVRRTALGCAPLALRAGAWLQWMSNPASADDPVTLRVLARYADDVGVGRPAASRGDAGVDLLRRLGLAGYAVPAERITGDRRVPDGCFALPARLLALSRRPEEFRAEILGADLCLRAVGVLPPLAVVRRSHPQADWIALDLSARRDGGPATSAGPAAEALDTVLGYVAGGSPAAAAAGFRWTLAGLRSWTADLLADVTAARDPAYEMAELVGARADEAAVHHDAYRLQDRPLSAWLRDSRAEPARLLAALAASPLVVPGDAGRSRLVASLVAERGPMFRIFSPDDLAVIRPWIDALPPRATAPTTAVPVPVPAPPAAGPPPRVAGPAPGSEGRAPASAREAYHLLQRRTDDPALRAWALDYARRWLDRSEPGPDEDDTQLPAEWPGILRPWLATQHARHDRQFETAGAAIPSRAALVDSTVQLAPLTLIDGPGCGASPTTPRPRREWAASCSRRTGTSSATGSPSSTTRGSTARCSTRWASGCRRPGPARSRSGRVSGRSRWPCRSTGCRSAGTPVRSCRRYSASTWRWSCPESAVPTGPHVSRSPGTASAHGSSTSTTRSTMSPPGTRRGRPMRSTVT